MLSIRPCLESLADYLWFLAKYPSLDALTAEVHYTWAVVPIALLVAIVTIKEGIWLRIGRTMAVSLIVLIPANLIKGMPVLVCEGLANLTILMAVYSMMACSVLYYLPRRPKKLVAALLVVLVLGIAGSHGVLLLRILGVGFNLFLPNIINALAFGDIIAVSEYLDNGFNVNRGVKDDGAMCEFVIRNGVGTISMLRFLVSRGARLDYADGEGCNLLMMAVKEDRLDEARYLMDKGLDPNRSDVFGQTALFYIDLKKHNYPDWMVDWTDAPALARLLLKYGADSQRRDNGGETPADRLRRLGRPDVAAILDAGR